jgi:surface polysaccharide O-acyltransferase-like enzyme
MERNYAIDYLKCLAIFFIVCIHTAPFEGGVFGGINGSDINFIINTFARFGVPFFFVASGFLFAQKLLTLTDTTTYFKKYMKKLVKLFIYWSLFYICYGIGLSVLMAIVTGTNIQTEVLHYLSGFVGVNPSIIFILYGTVGGPGSYHLWYLVALIWSILAVYIFMKINKLKVLLSFSLCLNIIGLFGQIYSGLFSLEILNVNIPTRDALFFGLFYTSLGSFCALHYDWIKQKMIKVNTSLLVVLFFVFSLVQICERSIASKYWEEEIIAVDYYLSTIFLTVCLFLFVLKNGHIGKNSVLSKIGKNAVGIYVSHTLFISLVLLSFEYLEIDIKEFFIFHLLFTPLVFMLANLYYFILQLVKQKVRMLLNKKKALRELNRRHI